MKEHECWRRSREVARIEKPNVMSDDHGGLMFGGSFKYEACGQGFGYRIDIEFVQSMMEVFGYPTRLTDIEGKACWVDHCHDRIHKVEPLLPGEGKPFDIDEWCEQASKRAEILRAAGADQYSIDKAKREAVKASKG